MGKFKFSMTFTARDIIVEADSVDEAEKIAKEEFLKRATQNNLNTINYCNIDAWNEVISKCRRCIMDFIDSNLEYLTEEHLKCYEEKYFCIKESALVYHFDYEYDGSLEKEYIKNNTGYELNDFEHTYLTQTLKSSVLEQIIF